VFQTSSECVHGMAWIRQTAIVGKKAAKVKVQSQNTYQDDSIVSLYIDLNAD